MIKTLKFIHCADIHLDAPFKEHGAGGYSETRRKDIRSAFLNILKRVNEEQADLLLISGDLYEHQYITKSTMNWLDMVLSEVEVPIVIIPGNHDPYLSNSWYRTWDWPSNVTILTPEHPHLTLEKEQVSLHGLGFASFKEEKPDLSKVPPPCQGTFNILMLHGTLDMNFTQQAYMPVTTEELGALGYDYYALGHFHTIREDYSLKNAVNPGSPEPLGFDEPGIHCAFLVTLTEENGKGSVESQRFKTAIRNYQDKDLDITGCKSLEEIKIRLLGLMDGLDPKRDLIRITLRGRTDLTFEPDMLSTFFSEDWLYLKIQDGTRKAFDLDILGKDPSLKGAFVREVQDRLRLLETDLESNFHNEANESLLKQKERLNLALYYGLEALQNGKIEWWGEL